MELNWNWAQKEEEEVHRSMLKNKLFIFPEFYKTEKIIFPTSKLTLRVQSKIVIDLIRSTKYRWAPT